MSHTYIATAEEFKKIASGLEKSVARIEKLSGTKVYVDVRGLFSVILDYEDEVATIWKGLKHPRRRANFDYNDKNEFYKMLRL